MNIALVGAECEENLALRYIRSALESRGHHVTQITFNDKGDTEAAAACLAHSGAELAGFSMVFTYRARQFAALARRSRELGYRGHLVAGGHFAAFNAEALLHDAPAFDSVGIGEGEDLMCALAERLQEPGQVRGLVWRDGQDRVHRNPPAEKPPQLDRLAPPTRLDPPHAFLGLPIANVLGSRGCTHSCDFCSIAAWHKLCGGARLRLREPAAIAEEIAGLYERGYRIFNFHDDNFFLPNRRKSLQRFWGLRGELQARGVGRIAFAVKSRPDSVDEETFGFLKEFGLFRVFLGIEAGTSEALRRLGRKQTLDQNERALEIVNRLGLHACFNLLLLNPDSTLEDFRANVAFLRQHSANPMNFCRTEVYSGTPLEGRLREQGRLLSDYWGYNYAIADPRAQAVFELIYAALTERHYGDDCVHHLTMRVDFERQLLDHFWGCPPSLARRVRDFVRRVNLNSCDYLDEIAEFAADGRCAVKAREEFVRGLSARAHQDNERFTEEATQLVKAFNLGSEPDVRRSRMWQQDAAALLTSSLTLAGIGSFTQPLSAAPYAAEMGGRAPTRSPVRPVELPAAPAATAEQKNLLQDQLLPHLAAAVTNPVPLRVRARFDGTGQCTAASAFDLEANQAVALQEIFRQVVVPELGGVNCEASFTREEVARARATETATKDMLRLRLGDAVISAIRADVAEAPGLDWGPPQKAELHLVIGNNGNVTNISVTVWKAPPAQPPGGSRAGKTEPSPTQLTNLTRTREVLGAIRITEPVLLGKPWSISYSSAELLRVPPFSSPPDWPGGYRTEMIAYPPGQ